MKKAILVFIVLICSCGTKNRTANTTAQNSVITADSSAQIPLKGTPVPQLVLDSTLKAKVDAAFKLLIRYSRETKVMSPQEAQVLLYHYTRTVFGKIAFDKTEARFEIEKSTEPGDLIVFFEDVAIEATPDRHVGTCHYPTDHPGTLISIVTEFVRKSSVTLIAGVLLHELNHHEMHVENILQNEADQDRNELVAYTRQLFFLTWAYNGPEIEFQCFQGGNVQTRFEKADSAEYFFYFNKVVDLKKKTGQR